MKKIAKKSGRWIINALLFMIFFILNAPSLSLKFTRFILSS